MNTFAMTSGLRTKNVIMAGMRSSQSRISSSKIRRRRVVSPPPSRCIGKRV